MWVCAVATASERRDGEATRLRRAHDSRDTHAHDCDATAAETTTSGEALTRRQATRRNVNAPPACHRRRRETR